MTKTPNYDFCEMILKDLNKRHISIFDEEFNAWAIRNDFCPSALRKELFDHLLKYYVE